jgi:hypothetical protein
MMIRIGCLDGHTYHSDHTSDEEVDKYLEECGGKVGTGTMSDVTVESREEFGEFFLHMCKYNKRNDTQTITLQIDGVSRLFNVAHIVWADVIWDQKESQ